jgi:hypothetical protein
VDVLATRFEESRDFWSGEILKGADADDWLKVYYERAEHERFPIEDVDRFLEQFTHEGCDVKLVVVEGDGECDVKLS